MIRSSALPWQSARARASREGTTSSSEPCTSRSGRGASFATRPSGLASRSSRVQALRSGGNCGSRMTPISRAWSRKRRGWAAQSSKSARAESAATPRTRSSSPAAQIASEPPVLAPISHTPPTPSWSRRWPTVARRSASQPPSEKSPSESPVPRKLNASTVHPASAAIRSASSGYVWADAAAPLAPAGKPWHTTSPGRPATAVLDGGRATWAARRTPPASMTVSTPRMLPGVRSPPDVGTDAAQVLASAPAPAQWGQGR